MTETTAPLIVLVRPQLGENIGQVARAMRNFGLLKLRLVNPRDGWPNPDAGPSAAGADDVLAGVEVFESVAAALADCTHIYATTVRKRGIVLPVLAPQAAAVAMHASPHRSAILFGAERAGLETEDVAHAHSIITIPVAEDFGSLNLAQAVLVCAYEYAKHMPQHGTLVQPPLVALDPPALQEETEGMIAQMLEQLEAADYFFPPARAHTAMLTIRTLFNKPQWNSQEVRTLRGVFRALSGARQRGRSEA
jgi:tRNA/rRNA methyltransferase